MNPGSELCKAVGQTFTTTPAVHTTTAYDARNNRINLQTPSLGETTYDPAHNYQVLAVYVPTGTGREHQTLYGYDTRHRLISIDQQLCTVSSGHACSTTTATGSDDYAYDDNDNRIQVVESRDGGTATTRNYCYDALDRLRAMKANTACTTTSGDETFTYDDAGNRLTAAGTSFTYDDQGQLASCSAGCGTIAYDDTGRTATANGWTLTYDGEGRLASACKVAGCATGDMVTMRYDGEGRRVELVGRPNGQSAVTTTFRYQGGSIAQEFTNGVLARTYVTDEAGTIVKVCDPDCAGTQYLVTWNGHGDALALWRIGTGGALTLANTFSYSTWGTPTVTTHNGAGDLGFRFLYVGASGVAWDDLGLGLSLLYMSARHYSPALGRFIQPDPSAAEANLYGYAGNSPVTKADPSGTIVCLVPPFAFVCLTAAQWAIAGLLGLSSWVIGQNLNRAIRGQDPFRVASGGSGTAVTIRNGRVRSTVHFSCASSFVTCGRSGSYPTFKPWQRYGPTMEPESGDMGTRWPLLGGRPLCRKLAHKMFCIAFVGGVAAILVVSDVLGPRRD